MNPSYRLAVSLCFIALLTVTAAQFTSRDSQDYSTVRQRGKRRCIPVGRRCSRFRRRCCRRSTCRRIVFGKGRRRRVRRLCVRRRLRPSVTPSPSSSTTPTPSASPSASPSAPPALDPCVALWFDSSIMPANFQEISQLTEDCPGGPASTNDFNFLRVPAPLCTGSCGTIVFSSLLARGTGGLDDDLVDCLASVLMLGYPYSSVAEIPPCRTIESPMIIDENSAVVLPTPEAFIDGAASCAPNSVVQLLIFDFDVGEDAQTLEAEVCGTSGPT